MSHLLPHWRGRTQVQRVELYTRGSLYVLVPVVLLSGFVSASAPLRDAGAIMLLALATLLLAIAGMALLRASMAVYPAYAPVPWRHLGVLLAATVATAGVGLALSEDARAGPSILAVLGLAYGAGGVRDRRVQLGVVAVCALMPVLASGNIAFAAYGVAAGLFLIFTVQSSLWLLEVVTELERSRTTQAALAVAEERLRFSRDVHDVLGRRLSTIAVQAELAATLAERGDARAPTRIREVRETAHHALREARELARGYRPLDLDSEIEGAVSLLRSAGITATADLDDLPEAWHEPVARVIREAVTNVLRHSDASRVEMTYAGGELVVRNDGASRASHPPGTGTGLVGLSEHLAPVGATLRTDQEGDDFVLRLVLEDRVTGAAP